MSETEQRDENGGASRTPDEIRAEIERTQQELGDTVEALAAKTDVKAQAEQRVEAARETVSEAVENAKESAQQAVGSAKETAQQAVSSARDSVRSAADEVRRATPDSAAAGAQQMTETVRSQPVPFSAAGAFAAGILVGWILGRR